MHLLLFQSENTGFHKSHTVSGSRVNPPKMARKYTIDFCNGPLFSKIILFTIPLVSSLLLLLAFNTADYIVVGRYASSKALAGVGATSSLTNLLTMFFFGLSVGGNVVAGNAGALAKLVQP